MMASISPVETSRTVTPAPGCAAFNEIAASMACARSPYPARIVPSIAISKRAPGLLADALNASQLARNCALASSSVGACHQRAAAHARHPDQKADSEAGK
jgi:hypothetical protein